MAWKAATETQSLEIVQHAACFHYKPTPSEGCVHRTSQKQTFKEYLEPQHAQETQLENVLGY